MLKKVLCVVLSLVLLLGTFSVIGSAASASDLEAALAKLPDDYNAQFYNDETIDAIAAAKAAAATASSASEIDAAVTLCETAFALVTEEAQDPYFPDYYYYVNRDETKAVVNYNVSTDATNVIPGETIEVTVSLKSNFYMGSINLALAYDKDVFELVSWSNEAVEAVLYEGWDCNPDFQCFANGTPAISDQRLPKEWLNQMEDGRYFYEKYKVMQQIINPNIDAYVTDTFFPEEETVVAVYTFKAKEDTTATEAKFFIDETLQLTYFESATDPDYANPALYFCRGAGPLIDGNYTATDGETLVQGWDMVDYQAQYDQKLVFGGKNATTYTSTDIYGETVTTNGCEINLTIGEDANYDDLDAAIITADEIKDNGVTYTNASLTPFDEAYNAAKSVSRDLLKEDQATVDTATNNLHNAIANLAPRAEYKYLDEAKAAAAGYSAGIYTAQSYAALTNAVADAANVDNDLANTQQAIIDNATNAINAAIAGLEEKASYAVLNDALAEAAGYSNADGKYTVDSFKALTDAVNAGKDIAADLPKSKQAIIDNAAAAITNAIAGLKEVVIAEGKIKSAKTTRPALIGDLAYVEIVVEGNPTKVRFVDASNATYTLTRDSAMVTNIADNGDGTETWTVKKKVNFDSENFSIYVKYAETGWDIVCYDFTLVAGAPVLDDRFVSYDIADDVDGVVYAGVHAITVKTGLDVTKVQFKKGVNTSTYTAENATVVEEDGGLTWTINFNLSTYGNNSYDIRTRTAKTAFASTGYTLDVLVYAE